MSSTNIDLKRSLEILNHEYLENEKTINLFKRKFEGNPEKSIKTRKFEEEKIEIKIKYGDDIDLFKGIKYINIKIK
jgi:hypothetical protein